jgi:hypothetical protein
VRAGVRYTLLGVYWGGLRVTCSSGVSLPRMEDGGSAPQLRVLGLDNVSHNVILPPGASILDAKEAISLAVGLAVGTFGLQNDRGDTTVPHATLTGNWNAVLLPRGSPPVSKIRLRQVEPLLIACRVNGQSDPDAGGAPS